MSANDTAPRKVNAIVAAARPVRLDDAKAAKATLSKRESWQDEAWAYYDEVAEVKYGCLYLGNGMSKVRFYASYELDDGTRVPVDHQASPISGSLLAKQADAEMARLRSALGGQGELNKQAIINWSVAGEFYVHGVEARAEEGVPGTDTYRPAEPEQWDVRSVSEVEMGSGSDAEGRPVIKIKSSADDQGRTIDPERETLIRMWVRHARWSNLADCHLRANLSDCEALVLFSNQQKAEAKSRQAAGLLLVPSELSFTENAADAEDNPEQNPFLQALLKALTEPIEDPTSSAAVMPLVISGPGEHLTPERFRLVNFARTTDATLDARIESRINRLARGMNVPVEVVMGHMSTTFSNAEQIDEDVFTDHFEPLCEALADAYASGFLLPQLRDTNQYEAEQLDRIGVWYDASALVRGPGAAESAEELLDRGAISIEAYRRLKGVSDDDAPDEVESLYQLVARKGMLTAELTTLLLKKVGILTDADVTIGGGGITDATGQPTAPVDEVAAMMVALTAAGGVNAGRRLSDIDRELRTKLLGAAEVAMARALERAGNRLKSRAGAIRETLRSVPAYRAAQHLGPNLVASAGFTEDDLLADAWDELEVQYKTWCLQAVEGTLEVLTELLHLSAEDRDRRRQQYALDIDEGWDWFKVELTEHAKVVLYAPERGAITAAGGEGGENDPSARVPVGLVRESTARAGGAKNIGGAPGVVEPSGSRPVGGIATGERTTQTLAEGGVTIEAYRWVYGPAQRETFKPHKVLDGQTFTNFDDPVLANRQSWPRTPFFYPGDHKGCVCDFEPILLEQPAATTRAANRAVADDDAPLVYDAARLKVQKDYGAKVLKATKAQPGQPVLVKNLRVGFNVADENSATIPYAAVVERNGRPVIYQLRGEMTPSALRKHIAEHPGTKVLDAFDAKLSTRGRKVMKQVMFMDVPSPSDALRSQEYGRKFTSAASAWMDDGTIAFWSGYARSDTALSTLAHEYGHLVDGYRHNKWLYGPSTDGQAKHFSSFAPQWTEAAAADRAHLNKFVLNNDAELRSTTHHHLQTGGSQPLPKGYRFDNGITSYGRANAKEDFAESSAMYLLEHMTGSTLGSHRKANGFMTMTTFADAFPNRAKLLAQAYKGLMAK